MTSYLIFSIAYCHVFEDLLRERSVEFKVDLVFSWYPSLWRHKAQYYFYPVHNNFTSKFKKLIFCPITSRLSLETATFLSEKGIFETIEYFSFIRIYGFQGKPSLLPFYVFDKLSTERVELRSCFNFLDVSIPNLGSSSRRC